MKHGSGVQAKSTTALLAAAVLAAVSLAVPGCAEPAFDASELIEVIAPQRSDKEGERPVFLIDKPGIPFIYAESLDPDRFRVWLNNVEITDAFNPRPGKLQRIDLPELEPGIHELVFELAPVKARRSAQYAVVIEFLDEPGSVFPEVFSGHGEPLPPAPPDRATQ